MPNAFDVYNCRKEKRNGEKREREKERESYIPTKTSRFSLIEYQSSLSLWFNGYYSVYTHRSNREKITNFYCNQQVITKISVIELEAIIIRI